MTCAVYGSVRSCASDAGGICGLETNLELKIKLRLHDRCAPRLVKLNLGRVPGAFELLQ
jgi:hypothetical protein